MSADTSLTVVFDFKFEPVLAIDTTGPEPLFIFKICPELKLIFSLLFQRGIK